MPSVREVVAALRFRSGVRLLALVAVASLLGGFRAAAVEDGSAGPPAPPAAAGETSAPLGPGAAAPDFLLPDLAGGAFHFAEENAKGPCLLVFWSIFCEPCRLELPIVERVYERNRDTGLRVAAISLDGEPLKGMIAGFVRQEGYSFPVLIDAMDGQGRFKVSDPYGVVATPMIFVVNAGGTIAFSGVGRVTEAEIEKALRPVPAK